MEDTMPQIIECKEVEDLFVDFVSGNLSLDKKESILNHIKSCKACEQFMEYGVEIMQDNDNDEIDKNYDLPDDIIDDPSLFFNKLSAKSVMKKETSVFEKIQYTIRNFTEDALSALVNIKWQLIPAYQLATVPVRLKSDPESKLQINCIRFNKTVDDIQLEIFAEHLETEAFKLDIFVRNKPLPQAIRFFLINPNDKQSSRQLVSEEPVSFENLKYGDYKIVVMQRGSEKGMLWLHIDESGVHER